MQQRECGHKVQERPVMCPIVRSCVHVSTAVRPQLSESEYENYECCNV